MKKIVVILAIAFLFIGTIYAQSSGRQRIPEPVKIEGTLKLQNGQFAVASEKKTYYVPMIGRYAGFIDGLKEGSNVSFEGYVKGDFLLPVKMTIGEKSYDLAAGRAFGERKNKDFNNRNDRNRNDRGRNDRGRKERGRNDRGFNEFGPRFGPYGGKGRR